MFKKLILAGLLVTSFHYAHSQSVTDIFNKLAREYPVEKIHFHFDKSIYFPGEIIWFKAYLFTGHLPSDISTVLYADLFDANDSLVAQTKLPVLQAGASGSFQLPRNITGPVTIRAYTQWGLNFDSTGNFQRLIPIYTENKWTHSGSPSAMGKTASSKNPTVSSSIDNSEGFNIAAEFQNEGILFTVKRADDNTSHPRVTLVAHMHQQLLYKASIDMQAETITSGRIPVGKFPAGMVHLVAFGTDNRVLAKQALLIHPDKTTIDLKWNLKPDTKSAGKMQVLELEIPDSLPTQISVSISYASLHQNAGKNNIVSNLLLGADFTENLNWHSLFAGNYPRLPYPADSYISWQGQLGKALTRQWKGKEMTMVMQDNNGKLDYLHSRVSEDGKFLLENLVYYDTVRLYLKEPGKKGLRPLFADEVTIHNSFLNKSIPLEPDNRKSLLAETAMVIPDSSLFRINELYQASSAREAVELEAITLTAKQPTKHELIEKEYATGMFAGNKNSTTILPEDDPAFLSSLNLLQYLQNRVPGLQVDPNVLENAISWRGSVTAIFIDEISQQTVSEEGGLFAAEDARVLLSIPMSDIALVKLYPPPFVGAWGNGAGGALAVYMKKTGSRKDSFVQGQVQVPGFTQRRDFLNNNKPGDFNTTLYWNPAILLGGKNRKLSINLETGNNQQALIVVIEAVNAAGKVLHVEKIIP